MTTKEASTEDLPSTQHGLEKEEEKSNIWIIKFSNFVDAFKAGEVKYVEIVNQVRAVFPTDYQLTVTSRRIYGGEIIYQIELSVAVPVKKYTLKFKAHGQKFEITLLREEQIPFLNTRNIDRKDTLLLTFQGANQAHSRYILSSHYDKIMKEMNLEVTKPTENQVIKDTNVLNGNKYCVIRKPENLNQVPNDIPITEGPNGQFTIRVTYFGQQRYCRRCDCMHTGKCPELEEFYRAKEERQAMHIKTKIASDSTLRHVQALGLSANVMCMSGGSLGQLATAIQDDPDTPKLEKIIINAGTNDIKNKNYSNSEFAHSIDAGLKKIKEIADKNLDKKFAIVQPVYDKENADENTLARTSYLTHEMDEFTKQYNEERSDTFQMIKPENVEIDETSHPTINGTLALLHSIQFQCEELIWNEKYITTEKMYAGVQTIYKYGCKGCFEFGQYPETNDFCPTCHVEHLKYKKPNYMEQIEQYYAEQRKNPKKRTYDEEDDKIVIRKRTNTANSNDSNSTIVNNGENAEKVPPPMEEG